MAQLKSAPDDALETLGLIWLITFILICGTVGCVAILGDNNAVNQTGIELEAHTDIDDDSETDKTTIEIEEK